MFTCPSCGLRLTADPELDSCPGCAAQLDPAVVAELAELHEAEAAIVARRRELAAKVVARHPSHVPLSALARSTRSFVAERKLAVAATLAALVAATELFVIGWGPATFAARLLVIVTVAVALGGIGATLERSDRPLVAGGVWSLAVMVLVWSVPLFGAVVDPALAGLALAVPLAVGVWVLRRGVTLVVLPLALLVVAAGLPVATLAWQQTGPVSLPFVAATFAAVCAALTRWWSAKLLWVRPVLVAGTVLWSVVSWSAAAFAPSAAALTAAVAVVVALVTVRRHGPERAPVGWRTVAVAPLLVAVAATVPAFGRPPVPDQAHLTVYTVAFAAAAVALAALPVWQRIQAARLAVLPAVVVVRLAFPPLALDAPDPAGAGSWGSVEQLLAIVAVGSLVAAARWYRGLAVLRVAAVGLLVAAAAGLWAYAALALVSTGLPVQRLYGLSWRWRTAERIRLRLWPLAHLAVGTVAAVTLPFGFLVPLAQTAAVAVLYQRNAVVRADPVAVVLAALPLVAVLAIGGEPHLTVLLVGVWPLAVFTWTLNTPRWRPLAAAAFPFALLAGAVTTLALPGVLRLWMVAVHLGCYLTLARAALPGDPPLLVRAGRRLERAAARWRRWRASPQPARPLVADFGDETLTVADVETLRAGEAASTGR